MTTLPLGRSVVGICVGVDRPHLLPPLAAAANGARRFHEWLLRQREHGVAVESTLLTDEGAASVARGAVLAAVKKALARSGDVLFLYLAGHGIAHSAYEEKLLLSGVLDDDAEAINLMVVRERSRRGSFPHVVVIYDACRSYANTERLRQVSGGPVFPLGNGARGGSHLDIFYACAPDESSFEVASDSGAHPNNYKAFFTEVLLAALDAPASDLVEPLLVGGRRVSVIPCARLETMLERDVPQKAALSTPAFEQSPDVDILSHMPAEYFAVIETPAAAAAAPDLAIADGDKLDLSPSRFPASADRAAMVGWYAEQAFANARAKKGKQAPATLRALGVSTGFERAAGWMRRNKGRFGFETHCGFTVIGNAIRRIDVSNNPPAEFIPNDSPTGERHYRIGRQPWDARGGTALIEFKDGSGAAVAILPGYVGALLVEEGHLRSLTYTLSTGTSGYDAYLARQQEVDERRAIFAATASVGRLEQLAKMYGPALPDYIRVGNTLDPCLGVLAAHAYHLIGDREQAEVVWQGMRAGRLRSKDGDRVVEVPVPFDVALLAAKLDRNTVARNPGIAPCCPWLSLGWSQLMDSDIALHPAIMQAGRHRRPGTWTSFSARGVAALREALLAKEIR